VSTALEDRLKSFARALLERQGAVVDWPEIGEGMALLPPGLARTLRTGEEATLTTAAATDARVLSTSLAADFLDRVEPLIGSYPTTTALKLEGLYLKRSPMDEPVARFFAFPNARVRVVGATPVKVAYHCWHFWAAVDSEDRWEDLVSVQVNATTGARVEFADPLTMIEPVQATEAFAASPPNVEHARKRAAFEAATRAGPFLARLEARLERDRRRIRDYYAALLAEASPARSRFPQDEAELAEKRRAVELEQRRRMLELDERYALRLRLDPVALVELTMPALAVELDVRRRGTQGTVRVYWNPLRKELEPLACAQCGENVAAVRFDEGLLPRCQKCSQE
jgi:hypothetical protein